MTTNAVSRIAQIPTSAAVEAFFARMARYPSSTVRLLANAQHVARAGFTRREVQISSVELKHAEHLEDDDDNDNDSDDVEDVSVHGSVITGR